MEWVSNCSQLSTFFVDRQQYGVAEYCLLAAEAMAKQAEGSGGLLAAEATAQQAAGSGSLLAAEATAQQAACGSSGGLPDEVRAALETQWGELFQKLLVASHTRHVQLQEGEKAGDGCNDGGGGDAAPRPSPTAAVLEHIE